MSGERRKDGDRFENQGAHMAKAVLDFPIAFLSRTRHPHLEPRSGQK